MKKELSILTAGLLLSMIAGARAQPDAMAFRPWSKEKEPGVDISLIKSCCEKVAKDKRRTHYYLNTRIFRMSMQLKGIYAKEGLLFFRLKLSNHSHLDYDVDSIRFFIADIRQPKNAVSWIHTVSPLYCSGNTRMIAGKSRQENVIVVPRFTLLRGKMLVIEISEKNGGRRLQLRADNFTLLRSRLI